ncbi:hypothetical protein SUGI_0257580 [Cryptomeria japonica]|nr:hypothetical protein SUGI_0257580 [Cryptomeria japonica]
MGLITQTKQKIRTSTPITQAFPSHHLNLHDESKTASTQPLRCTDIELAKLVGRDFSRVLTTTRGTRGYLAPEWIFGLPISPKVDVYSFGMTLLEIISGRRNIDLNVQDSSKFYFPPWAATQIQQGNVNNVVEEGVAEEADMEEVRRACVVELLCIQEDEEVRPSMGQVVQMLEGKIEPQTPQISSSTFRPEHPSDTSSYSEGNVTSKKNVNGSMHSKMKRHCYLKLTR